MTLGREFDLAVIGGGAAGLTAATEARRCGAKFFVEIDGRTARPGRHAHSEGSTNGR